MARFGCFLAFGWLLLLCGIGVVFMATSGCDSSACEGWWWAAALLIGPAFFAGLIMIPIGLISANALAKEREAVQATSVKDK